MVANNTGSTYISPSQVELLHPPVGRHDNGSEARGVDWEQATLARNVITDVAVSSVVRIRLVTSVHDAIREELITADSPSYAFIFCRDLDVSLHLQ